eukprot:166731-Chlamydomonas_euryale.AAC.4
MHAALPRKASQSCRRAIAAMSTPARKRLMRDFKRLKEDPPQGVNGSPNPDNIMLWNAVIFGPEDTPWDGGEPPMTLHWHADCLLEPRVYVSTSPSSQARSASRSSFPKSTPIRHRPSSSRLACFIQTVGRASLVLRRPG